MRWNLYIYINYRVTMGNAVAQLVEALRYKPGVRGFDSRWCQWNFSLTQFFRPQYGLGSTESPTVMSTRNNSWGVKVASAYMWQTCHFHVQIILKSGSLNFLEPSGPVQACTGIALPFTFLSNYDTIVSHTLKILTRLIVIINPLRPNDNYSGRTSPLISKRCILYIYSSNIGT